MRRRPFPQSNDCSSKRSTPGCVHNYVFENGLMQVGMFRSSAILNLQCHNDSTQLSRCCFSSSRSCSILYVIILLLLRCLATLHRCKRMSNDCCNNYGASYIGCTVRNLTVVQVNPQKQRDVVAAANLAAQKSRDGQVADIVAPTDVEHWWDEMLAIQIVAALLTAVFSFVGMLASGWSEQVSTVTGSDVPIYIVFGMYIPFVLLMFSLAPRYIATAEMGCIKMLGACAVLVSTF